MSSATKPVDRRRPFRRVDNQAFLPQRRLDGDGVACGCRTQKDLGDIDARLDALLDAAQERALGKALKSFLDAVRAALHPSKLASILADLIKKELGTLPAIVLRVPLEILGGLGEILLAPVNAIVDPIIGAIERGARAFMRLFATPLLMRAIRVLPQWVSVLPGASNNVVDRSQVIEVEGVCLRSFGNPVDVPLVNWHLWFAWNVIIDLEPEYARARSPVSDPPNTSGAGGAERSLIPDGGFEIQWDAGALLASDGGYRVGFQAKEMPRHEGPMTTAGGAGVEGATDFQTDFFWPVPGMFVWASGRHVYDCSRVTHRSASATGRDAEATPPRMCAMVNPARALATARFQGVVFPENGEFAVPAIEFLFVSCRRGGYLRHEALADEDYVFIIDLPPGPAGASPFPVADTDHVPHNTITLRPRLLRKIKFLSVIGSGSAMPVIEPMPPAEPGRAPQQVRVRIPQVALAGADAYGFRLSMGWHDPTRELARRVLIGEVEVTALRMRLTDREAPMRKMRNLLGDQEKALRDAIMAEIAAIKVVVPVINKEIRPLEIPAIRALVEPVVTTMFDKLVDAIVDLMPTEAEEEWLLRIGVDGLWAAFFLTPSKPTAGPKPPVEFVANGLVFRTMLAEGDELRFASHGAEFDPVGDIMHTAVAERTLRLRESGAPVPWATIVDPPTKRLFDEILTDLVLALMFDTTEGASKLSLGFDNSPLGIVEPGLTGGGGAQDNPMVVAGPLASPVTVRRRASFARAIPPEMVLVEDRGAGGRPDYEITCQVRLRRQIEDDSQA